MPTLQPRKEHLTMQFSQAIIVVHSIYMAAQMMTEE